MQFPGNGSHVVMGSPDVNGQAPSLSAALSAGSANGVQAYFVIFYHTAGTLTDGTFNVILVWAVGPDNPRLGRGPAGTESRLVSRRRGSPSSGVR